MYFAVMCKVKHQLVSSHILHSQSVHVVSWFSFFVSPVAAAEALTVLQVSHAQQERGQLLPASQRRIPPSPRPHRLTSAAAVSPARLRVPPGLRALPVAFAVDQPRPLVDLALACRKSLEVDEFQSAAQVPVAAGEDALFPGARLPSARQLPAVQAHDPR